METNHNTIPLIGIVGPTASGKSSHAITLAKEYNGEIVSADSRQVYRGLNIGSGKVTSDEKAGIPHHLLDVADPGERFTVADYKLLAESSIHGIYERGRIPFLVGGSSLYVDVIVENYLIPKSDYDENYRAMLQRKDIPELLEELHIVDPALYESIDKQNKRRIMRGLEVFHLSGIPLSQQKKKGERLYNSLIIGVSVDRAELYTKIDSRVDSRIKEGMINEVEQMLSRGVSIMWLKNLGLEYRVITEFLCGSDRSDASLHGHIQKLKYAIHDFARRQLVWYRRNTSIQWCSTIDEMRRCIDAFLLNQELFQ